MTEDEIVEIGARALCEENTVGFGVEWNRATVELRGNCRIEMRAVLTALHEAGLAVVPVEPTEAMLEAGRARANMVLHTVGGIYQDMIRATGGKQ